jgi:hypothetical protein
MAKKSNTNNLHFTGLYSSRVNLATFFVGIFVLILALVGLYMIHLTENGHIFIATVLVLLYVSSLVIRRAHDSNHAYGITQYDMFLYRTGDPKSNKYGQPPKSGVNFLALFWLEY